MERWVGKTAVVTGASAGIGAATALILADAGMTVVAAARRLDKLQEVQKRVKGRGRLICCQFDMSKEEDIVALMDCAKKQAGGIDVLINNAAFLPPGTITDCNGLGSELKLIEDALKINVMSVVTASRIAAADIARRKVPGHIIVINSIAGHKIVNLGVTPGTSVYGATKYAVTAINEIIRLEFSYTKAPIRMTVGIDSISPGAVDTAMLHSVPNLPSDTKQLNPVDIANAVLYALSVPQSVNITELTIQPTGETL